MNSKKLLVVWKIVKRILEFSVELKMNLIFLFFLEKIGGFGMVVRGDVENDGEGF